MIIERDRWLSELHAYAGQEPLELIFGGYIATNVSPVSSSTVTSNTAGWYHTVVDASEGDYFTVAGGGGQTPRLWCFISSDGTILDNAEENTVGNGLVIVAPENTSKAIFNISIANSSGDFYVHRGRLPESLMAFPYDDIYGCVLSPLERNIFPGRRKNMILGTGNNARVADAIRNHFYSEGQSGASGTTVSSVVLSCNAPSIQGNMTVTTFAGWKKSFFRPINTALSTRYLYLTIDKNLNRNSASTGITYIVATYNSSGVVSMATMASTSEGYSSIIYKLSNEIVTNGNICVAVALMNAKMSIDVRFGLELAGMSKANSTDFPALASTGKTVADD